MYFVKYGKEYLHDPRIQDCIIFEPSLECEKNTCGFFDFTIYPDNPLHDKLKERDSSNPIEVYDDDILLFSGFIYELGKEFYLSGQVKCKGELAYLKDSIVRPYSTIQRGYGTTVPSTVDGYFEWLIQQHNAQVDSTKQFEIGINQGSSLDKNNYIYRESNQYPNTLDELNEKILDSLGGYLRIRHENGKRYIDLLYECTDENTQILDFGVNLTDYNQTDSSLDVYTYVVPLGAKMKDTEYSYYNGYFVTKDTTVDPEKVYYEKRTDDDGYTYYSQCSNLKTFEKGVTYYEYDENYDESDLSLTIAAMEDGPTDIDDYKKVGDYIYCISAVNKYGFIGYTYEDQDVTTVENLVLYSIIDLRSRISPIRTIEIKAIDMHLVNPDIKPIRIGEYVRVRSVPHNLDSYFLCTSIELNLNNPENSLYTLGTTFDTLTGQQNKQIKLLNSSINQAYEQAEKLTEQQKKNAISAIDALNQSKAANDTAIEASTKVDEANSKADEASAKADSANTKAEEAINNAKDAADAAAAASNKADEATANVTLIQNRITTIEGNTEEAIANAAAAKEAADAAQVNADAAATAASNAQSAADAAQNKADEAYTAAGNVASQVSSINEEITGIKEDATALRNDLEGQIETVTNTMTADYAKKTDLSSVESSLKTEISTSAAGIKTEVSQTYATKTALATTDSKADTAKNTADQAKASADANATDLANAIISFNSDVDSLQNQIDGSIQTWFYEVEPTDENAPAKDWTTTELKNIHLGDLYYDTITGYCYRYQVQNNQYSWQRITDVDVTKALADAAKAQETANNKRRVFVVTPTPPYDVGDLWVQGSTGDIMRCNIAKTNQQSYAESDWVKASKYTDDSAVTDLANTVETTYSTKSEVHQLSDQISSTVSSVEEVRVNAAAAQKTASDAASAAIAAQSTADTAKANAATAQSAADAAKANAAAAQKKADEAASNLSVAENNLADLQKQADATDEQLAAAQAAVVNAKKAADAAQADADAAATAASNAQSTANTAKTNAATAQSTANSAKKAAEKAQSDVNSLTNRVTASETKISQNSEAIKLRATKTEVTEAIDDIQIGGRNLFRQSGHWDTKPTWWIDNGGGIELDTSVKYMGYNTIKTTVGLGIAGNNNCYFGVDTNKIYTYSAMIKLTGDNYTGDGNSPLNCHCSSTGTDYGEHDGVDVIKYKQDLVNGEWTLLYLTFRPKGKYFRPFVYIGYGTRVLNIAYLKLEEGTKPTDWTPAPEDVEDDATDKANAALANAKSYTDAQIQVTSEAIKLRATKTEVTEAIDDIQIGGRNLARNTSSDFMAIPFTAFNGSINICTSLDRVYTTNLKVGDTITVRLVYKYENIVPADGKTAMCWIQGSGNVTEWNNGIFYGSPGLALNGSGEYIFEYRMRIVEEHLRNTFWNTAIRHDYIQSGSVNWKCFKVEKGTKPTDWTPAPEDVEDDATDKANAALANAKSYTDAQIQVTSESITSTVSKTYATKTDLSTTNSNVTKAQNTANAAATAASNAQSTANTAKSTADSASKSASSANTAASNAQKTADTAKANAATAQSTANSVKNDLAANYSTTTQMNSAIESVQTELTQTSEEIRMDFNKTVTTYVDGLQNQIDDNTSYAEKQFNTINKYIRFVDGKIILGEMGNELTLTIQNDRLSFMQSNVEVAYFSDNKLYINQAEVLTSLKIGKFEWVPGTDGSLSLRKRG